MGMFARFVRTLRGRRHRDEIREELQFHLDMDAADVGARDARLRLGNRTRIEEDTRAAGIVEWIESAIRDASHGLRQLRRTPGLSIAMLLSLALGLGANVAIVSLFDAAILKPLPVHDPDSLTILEWTADGFPPGVENLNGEFRALAGARRQGSSVSAAVYRQLAAEQQVFAPLMGVGAYPEPAGVAVDEAPARQVAIQYVSGNFFDGVGVQLVLGRGFLGEEDRVGHEPVVVVSHRFWVNALARREDSLGRTLRINNVAARIVGVAPSGFFGVRPGQWPDVYAPLAAKVTFQRSTRPGPLAENDANWWVRVIGRLKPGIAAGAAQAALQERFVSLAVPDAAAVEAGKLPELVTMSGRRGFDALSQTDGRALRLLVGLVGVLLLVICANVANLLLARSVARQHESAVRVALGASGRRLLRQHLIESGMLALIGGAAGLVVGYALAQSIHVLFQTGRDASSAYDLHVDLRTLAFAGALALCTAVLFGLAPAIQASRADLGDALRTQSRTVAGGWQRLPRVLVSVQIALCLTAMMAAGLLGRSLANLEAADIGFDRRNLTYVTVHPSRAGYPPERLAPYADRVRAELSKLPGVVRVSPASFRVFSGMGNNARLNFPGRPFTDDYRANLNSVSDGFFETLGVPVIAGRPIDRRDMHSEAEAAVVDAEFVRRYLPHEDPLGRRFGLDQRANDRYAIVGVVANARYNSLRGDAYPTVYLPYVAGGTINFAIRSAMDQSALAEPVRRAVALVDPQVPLTEFHAQAGLIDRMLRTERLLGFLAAAFGIVATIIAASGLGGLLAYAVARRNREIAVRMALGARAADVIRMVLRESWSIVTIGVLLGIPCIYGVARALATTLFGLRPLDPGTAAASIGVVLAVAFLASWIPARRAARVDPVIALRQE